MDNMLRSSSVAVNQLAHVQGMRRSVGRGCSMLRCLIELAQCSCEASRLVDPDLFAGKVPEALRIASEDRSKQLLFQAAMNPAGRGGGQTGSTRGPPRASQRGGFRKHKRFTPTATTHKRSKPQATLSWRVEKGKGAKLGVTTTWSNKPKV